MNALDSQPARPYLAQGRGSTMIVAAALVATLAGACTEDSVLVTPPDDDAVVRLVSWPAEADVGLGEALDFRAWRVRAAGDSTLVSARWSATAGSIDGAGHFVAPSVAGSVWVVARDPGGSGAADTSLVSVRGPDPLVPVSIQVTPGPGLDLHPGQGASLSAVVTNHLGALLTGVPLDWSSSAPAVVGVDGAGVVAARSVGAAWIVARVQGAALTDSAEVRVTPVPVAAVVIAPQAATIPHGGSQAFTASVLGPEGQSLVGRTVTWSSAAAAVAPIDGNGTAAGASPGTTTISAAAEGVVGTAILTVVDTTTVVGSVTLDPVTASLQVGQTVALTAVVRDPAGVVLSEMPVSWASRASLVASVDATGTVTARTPGTALIDATSRGVVGSAQITVTAAPPPAVATVEVTPAAPSVQAGNTVQLTAVPRSAAGVALTGRVVTWTSASTGTATVDPATGLVSGVSAGTARIDATSEGMVGSVTVTVTAPPPPAVATVEVTPAAPSVQAGNTVQLTAVPRSATGVALTGRVVTWTSVSTGTATVDPATGLVSGVSAGTARIDATSEGVVGSVTVTVTAAPSGTLANECQSPGSGWIWCDDFDQDRLAAYFEYDAAGGAFSRTAGIGADGSTGMRARFSPGQVGAGSLHLAVGRTPQAYFRPADAGTADYRELYYRVYLRHQPGWVGGGGDKLSRAFVFASPTSWAQAMIAHVWSTGSGGNYLGLDPVRGTDAAGTLVTTQYNDFANMTWLGLDASNTPVFDAAHVGSWYCIETHVRLNDAGQSNGVFELWIDDQLEAQRSGLNWLGSFSAYGLNAVFLENYWNSGSPVQQERYMDNFVVATQRIGC